MRIRSPLSNLSDVLSQVKQASERYKDTLRKNEASTRAVLIDPILRALGWDTANTYMVEVERTLDKSRVDYALYDYNGNVSVIIEAKSLHTSLNQPDFIMSLVHYAFTFKLQDIFLTDGIIWHHFTSFQPGNVPVARALDLQKDDPIETAAYLVQRLDAAKFWPEEQTIDRLAQQVDQLESTVATLRKEIDGIKLSVIQPQEIASDREEGITGDPTQYLDTKDASFIALQQLGDVTGKKPKLFRLPDGNIIPVKKWRDILVESCKFILEHDTNIPIPYPDRSGKKVSLFSDIAPPEGISFVTEQYREQDVYIYINYDARNCVSNANYILQRTPKNLNKMVPAIILVSE